MDGGDTDRYEGVHDLKPPHTHALPCIPNPERACRATMGKGWKGWGGGGGGVQNGVSYTCTPRLLLPSTFHLGIALPPWLGLGLACPCLPLPPAWGWGPVLFFTFHTQQLDLL